MEAVSKGTTVSYFGSYPKYHGKAEVVTAYPDTLPGISRDGYRYGLLTKTGELISLVRRQSFAVVSLP